MVTKPYGDIPLVGGAATAPKAARSRGDMDGNDANEVRGGEGAVGAAN